MKYVLALDQGTTSSRAIVFNKKGQIVGKAQQEFRQIYPKAGWVEHDPHDVYGTQVAVISEALIRANATIDDVAAIGITNQRETTFVWDKRTGVPVYNAIGGQELYSFSDFRKNGIALKFLKTGEIKYQQFGDKFVQGLSIVDALMFNSKEEVQKQLQNYTLVQEEE